MATIKLPHPLVTRFAPSPTGDLHVGGARTALFNYLLAKNRGGTFLLRIEDTDTQREKPEAVAAIMDGLAWLGLTPSGPPVFQSENARRHATVALELVERGAAYYAFETTEELATLRAAAGRAYKYDRTTALGLTKEEITERIERGDEYVVRFLVSGGVTSWDDLVTGRVEVNNAEIEDFVVLRSQGQAVYNLAVSVDDHDAKVNLVMRGDDHLSNTPKQILIYRAMGWPVPVFAHLPMILGEDKKKLSKRHGATATAMYAEMGFLPEAMRNALALLGWSPGGDLEYMTAEELVDKFSVERLLQKSSVFDMKKLTHYNYLHMRALTSEDLAGRLAAMPGMPKVDFERLVTVVHVVRENAKTLIELREGVGPFVAEIGIDEETRIALAGNAALAHFAKAVEANTDWQADSLALWIKSLPGEAGISPRNYFSPIRTALTGKRVAPPMHDTLSLLGRELVRERLGALSQQVETPKTGARVE